MITKYKDEMLFDSYTIKTRLMSRLVGSKYIVYDFTSAVPCETLIVRIGGNSDELVITINEPDGKLEVKSVIVNSDGSLTTSDLWEDILSEEALVRSCDLVKDYIEEVMNVGYDNINLYSPSIYTHYEK